MCTGNIHPTLPSMRKARDVAGSTLVLCGAPHLCLRRHLFRAASLSVPAPTASATHPHHSPTRPRHHYGTTLSLDSSVEMPMLSPTPLPYFYIAPRVERVASRPCRRVQVVISPRVAIVRVCKLVWDLAQQSRIFDETSLCNQAVGVVARMSVSRQVR